MDPHLFTLLRCFYALVPTKELKFPEGVSLGRLNDFFLTEILLSSHFQSYPSSYQYQKGYWKWVLQNLEYLVSEDDDDIDSRIYGHYLGLISRSEPTSTQPGGFSSTETPPSCSFVTYFWHPYEISNKSALKQKLIDVPRYSKATLSENRTTVEKGTTGLRTWLASFVLAQYLISHPTLVVSKSILELGSGIGFLGIIVGTLQLGKGPGQSGSLWLTDVSDEVLQRCRENLSLPCNSLSLHPALHYLKLDWFDSITADGLNSSFATLIHEKVDPDLIIGADIVFDPSLIPCLVSTIKLSLQRRAKCALIALAVRNELTLSRFLTHLQESSLHVEDVAFTTTQTFINQNVETDSDKGTVKIFCITI